ncbi:hypothetical protein JCM10908_001512 [Rhodotorula pacifica]|uniref:F-box protein n=1 Tax=Rhodotorula pacifica TaxID=1495444 RepID=UPI00316FD936
MPPRKKRDATTSGEDPAVDGSQQAAASAPEAGTSRSSKGKHVTFEDPEDTDDGDTYEEPATKKRKTTATTAKKGKGKARKPKKLELFQAMPLDVLVLIMEELDTKTLLAMYRTCSAFRSLLRSDQGATAWKSARANTGAIPDLQAEDLPEWMLASLLFDSTCHICQKGRASTVDYVLRGRGCASCMRKNSCRRDKMKNAASFHGKVWECVPESKWTPGYGGGVSYTFYWMPTVDAVSERLLELDGKDGFDEYVAERRKVKAAATADGAALAQWETRYAMEKKDDKRNASKARRQKIKEKLKELGYAESELWVIYDNSLVDQPRDLTDRIWNNIKPQLVHILDQEREIKRQNEIAQAMRARSEKVRPFYDSLQQGIASDGARSLFPPFGNFLLFSSVEPLYEPEDALPTAENFGKARQGALDEADTFAQAIQRAFLGRLVKAHMDLRKLEGTAATSSGRYLDAPLISANDAFALAKETTSVIKCPKSWCSTYATFPAILDHIKVCDRSVLTEGALSITPAQIAAVRHVVESAGMKVSPSTTTASLYALGDAFQCEECAPKDPALNSAQWSSFYNAKRSWALMLMHILAKHCPPDNGPLTFPKLIFTPPAPKSPGQANPGGFVVNGESDAESVGL